MQPCFQSFRSLLFTRTLLLLPLLTGIAISPLLGQSNRPTTTAPMPTHNAGPVKIVVPTENQGAAMTGGFVYPINFVLANLGLPDLTDEEQKDIMEIKTLPATRPATSQPATTSTRPHTASQPAEDLPTSQLTARDLRGLKILSLGEGFGDLVPYLRKNGADAYGLDLWYDPTTPIPANAMTSSFMRKYRDKYQQCLIEGDATNLCGFSTDKFDMVLSHKLLTHLNPKQQGDMIRESIRVLKPGGTLRFNTAEHFESEDARTKLRELLSQAGFDVRVYYAATENQIRLLTQKVDPCQMVRSFSRKELEEIDGALSHIDSAIGLYSKMNEPNALLVIQKLSSKKTAENTSTPDGDVEQIVKMLHAQSPLSLTDVNSLFKRLQASGKDLDEETRGLQMWINSLGRRDNQEVPLIRCYGFIPLWITTGAGENQIEKIQTGLAKWRGALISGQAVEWPDPNGSCLILDLNLNTQTGAVTRN